ncbi:tyrosine-type recombinase/integrase [Nocardia aurantiaca]
MAKCITPVGSTLQFICGSALRVEATVGQVRAIGGRGVRLADARAAFLATIPAVNTRRGYAVALDALVRDFGPDSDVGLLEPERVGGWFTLKWGNKSAQTFNVRLAALRSAREYWRKQGWLVGDPLSRLVSRAVPPDHSRALTRDEVAALLGMDAPLRERVLWHMLYETAARAEELLLLDIPDLDMPNRCATVIRKGGATDIVAWQTGTARLLPRLLAGRRTGPLYLTDRKAKSVVAKTDTDPDSGRAVVVPAGARGTRGPHRRVFAWSVHIASAAAFETDSCRRGRGVHSNADADERAHLGTVAGQVRPPLRRGIDCVAGPHRPSRSTADVTSP